MTETNTETVEAPASITPKDFAEMVGSDPKTVRRFLRSISSNRAGKGGRWTIDASDVDELKTRWAARGASQTVALKLDEDEVDDIVAETDAEFEELTDDVDELEDIDEL